MSQEEPKVQEESTIEQPVAEKTGGNESIEGSQRKVETEEQRAERLKLQEEVDSRSVYVGNVDYKSTPEQLENFFLTVGEIERVTILYDRYSGLPKGYAYIEFQTVEQAQKAISDLSGNQFRGRDLRVTTKRTNLPRMSVKRGGFRGGRARGRGRGSFRGRISGGGRGRGRGRASSSDEPPSNPPPTADA